jgi:hypothetical protein
VPSIFHAVVLSELLAKAILFLNTLMNDDAIDQAILSMLSAAKGRWRKVAMVIGRVAEGIGSDLQDDDARYELVARRIEALVDDGRLVAQGDIKKWRFSEVRRPS